MKDDQLVELLMDIKERLSSIETTLASGVSYRARVEKVETKVERAEASLKTLRWVMGGLLLTVPATVAAVVRAWHS